MESPVLGLVLDSSAVIAAERKRQSVTAFIEAILKTTLEKFTPDTPVTMTFRKAHFNSGHDLKDFADKLGIELGTGDVEQ